MKKFLPYILILAVVAVGALGPFSAAKSSAATITGAIKDPTGISLSNCVPLFDFSLDKCVAAASYYLIFMPTSSVLWFAGQIMNVSVSFSLDGNTLKTGMVESGWKISRDFVNLLFIFILLYIAIATILQLSGYGMKELLVRVIIIALLVNFSLLITRVVVDASNILAIEFYEKMTTKGGTVAKFIGGEDARSISQVFVDGFDPQKLFNNKDFLIWQKDTAASPLALLMMFILASLMNLVGAFVLFAGAILFIIRIAVLWILMILAPLAFVAMALPATKQYASQWWTKLFHQSFFAPAFLFMFYLVAMMVNPPDGGESFIAVMGKSIAKVSTGKTGIESFFAIISTILLQFIVMTVLMVASIMVAQKMGAVGAGTMQSWGQSAKKWGQAKAGKISRRGAGWAAERMLDKENEKQGRIARWGGALASKIPFANRGLAKLSGMREQENKKRQKEWEKEYGSYSKAGLDAMLGNRMMTDAKRKVIQGVLEKRDYGKEQDKWYKENKDKDFDKEITTHREGLALAEATIPTVLDIEERKKWFSEKEMRRQKIKEAEKSKERRDKIESQKFGAEGSYAERIKKLEESGGVAKPAPASTPKT